MSQKGPKCHNWGPWDSLWPLTQPYLAGLSTYQCQEPTKFNKWNPFISLAFNLYTKCFSIYITAWDLVFFYFPNFVFIVSSLCDIHNFWLWWSTNYETTTSNVFLFSYPNGEITNDPILRGEKHHISQITPFAMFIANMWIARFSKASAFH